MKEKIKNKTFYIQSRSFQKIYSNPLSALKDIPSGSKIIFGGFGLCGIPENSIHMIKEMNIKDLICISNHGGVSDFGLGLLMQKKQIKRIICSFVGNNNLFERLYLNGELEMELVPQGTLAEKLRSAGAGIPAFYTPTGFGTIIQNGGFPIKLNKDGSTQIASKRLETRKFNGIDYVLEKSIYGDYSIIKAWKGDAAGNLIFRRTAKNFNIDAAKAGKITIAEVEQIVPIGSIHPDNVDVPGIYVNRIFQGQNYEKRIEKKVLAGDLDLTKKLSPERDRIIRRALKEIKDGMYINLGIGLPNLVPEYYFNSIKNDSRTNHVTFHSENGLLGIGPYCSKEEEIDADLINAGKEPVTLLPYASTFSSSESFNMIRGAHLDLIFLGAFEIEAETGYLANWIIPNKKVKGMGGAMDLVSSGTKIIVLMEHLTKKNNKRIVEKIRNLPLTGKRFIHKLITNLGVFEFNDKDKLVLVEKLDSIGLKEIREMTGGRFKIDKNLKSMKP